MAGKADDARYGWMRTRAGDLEGYAAIACLLENETTYGDGPGRDW